jgi:hypothetical protein
MVNYQQFNNSFYQSIEMVKGDSLIFNFQLQGLEGARPSSVTFAAAHHYDEDPYFTCTLEDGISLEDYDAETDTLTYAVAVAPGKTKYMDVGRHYYDLQIIIGDDVLTLMRGDFNLLFELSR